MASSPEWRLGVDGLPLGTQAVLVVDGEVACSFAVVDGGGRAVDLQRRVVEAVARAGELAGAEVGEVRLVLVDDDGHGDQLDAIRRRLAESGISFHTLEPSGATPADPGGVGPSYQASLSRARTAALG